MHSSAQHWLLTGALLALGCSDETATAKQAVVATSEASDDTAPAAARAPEPTSLRARLAAEAATRPTGTPTVEEVLAALESAGVSVPERRQFLAATVAARYCAGGRTAKGLAVSVCEYESAEAAKRGRKLSRERFGAAAPARDILINRATTLTLGGEVPAEQKGASEAFAKL